MRSSDNHLRVISQEIPQLPNLAWKSHLKNFIQFSQQPTHWGRMTHIFVSKLTTIGSDNGLSPRSHYPNQCRNIVNWILKNKLKWNFNQNSYIFIKKNAFENVCWKMAAILSPLPQWVKLPLSVITFCHMEPKRPHMWSTWINTS